MTKLKQLQILTAVILITLILSACRSGPEEEVETPTPTPRPTRHIVVPQNDNVEALNAAQAAMQEIDFGFAPLLLKNQSRLVLETRNGDEEIIRLDYPDQPDDPTAWETVDSFAAAYGVRRIMLNLPQVNRIALGNFGVAASLGDTSERINHVAAWVTFMDGSRAVVDLTPLATNFAARHTPDRMLVDDNQIEFQYAQLRQGVDLNDWQPMTIIEQDGEQYYLLARVQASYDQYSFSLRLHPIEPADPMEPLSLRPGALAGVEINRDQFSNLQELIIDAGPTAFEQHPELLTRGGSDRQPLVTILDSHLHLLWHLIIKFEHRLPDAGRATPTPTFTPTPLPTPTPTPTPTPKKLPLMTS